MVERLGMPGNGSYDPAQDRWRVSDDGASIQRRAARSARYRSDRAGGIAWKVAKNQRLCCASLETGTTFRLRHSEGSSAIPRRSPRSIDETPSGFLLTMAAIRRLAVCASAAVTAS